MARIKQTPSLNATAPLSPKRVRKPRTQTIKFDDDDDDDDEEKTPKPKPKPKAAKRSIALDENAGGDRNEEARSLGRQVRQKLDVGFAIPEYQAPNKIRQDVLNEFVVGDVLKEDKVINSRYRAYGPAMDETFSTATTREFTKGLFELGDKSSFSEEEWEYLGNLMDIMSAARIPTEYSGYALEGSIMQHPASRPKAYFTDPYATASAHSYLDSDRRNHVQKQMAEVAMDKGSTASDIMLRGAQAAIEFTLNNFTAPITADNVMPYTRRANTKIDDPKNVEQVNARELLKRIYCDIGGKLRTSQEVESDEDALRRSWDRSAVVRPPSPLRTGDRGDPGMDVDPSISSAPPISEMDLGVDPLASLNTMVEPSALPISEMYSDFDAFVGTLDSIVLPSAPSISEMTLVGAEAGSTSIVGEAATEEAGSGLAEVALLI